MIQSQFPGKLFILGEYAVTESGQKGVIAAINRFMYTRIEESSTYAVHSTYGYLDCSNIFTDQGSMRYVSAALSVANQLVAFDRPFNLTISSDLDSDEGKKYGFGSSGVVVVAVLKSILDFYGYDIDKLRLFKLAVLVQKKLGEMSSGGDLAAAIYGGLIEYTRYNEEWLSYQHDDVQLIDIDWPLLAIKELPVDTFRLIVGWTGSPNNTTPYVKNFRAWGYDNSLVYSVWLKQAKELVNRFVDAIVDDDFKTAKCCINRYRDWMFEVSHYVGIEIESIKLHDLIESAKLLGLASKISGSGGGDCGIVCDFYHENENIEKLRLLWNKHDIVMLDVEVWNQ